MKHNDISIEGDHSGGNIKLKNIDDQIKCLVELEQDIRDSKRWWFYWNFSLQTTQQKTFTFKFINGEVIGPWGPAISRDRVKWEWAGQESLLDQSTFEYQSRGDGNKIYFSFSLPYQLYHFEKLYEIFQEKHTLKREVLTLSEGGRAVPLLKIGNPAAKKDIVFTARHHCCESTASYLLEGMMTYFLQEEPEFLQEYQIHIIPFVDLDGVEKGDQGKERYPHDHNRDYLQQPIYNSTKAIIEYVNKLNLSIGIDFHSPYKWGGRNNYPFFVQVKGKNSPIKREVDRLGGCLKKINTKRAKKDKNIIIYTGKHNIDKGQDWNTGNNPTCSQFFAQKEPLIAATFEMPYFGNEKVVFNQDNIYLFGKDFAKAIEDYLNKQ